MSIWTTAWAGLQVMKWTVQHEIRATHPVINPADLLARKGQTVVITGGTRGIGSAVVKKLLEIDTKVIVGCRNVADADKLLVKIRAEGISSGSILAFPLDLTSLKSVREFAAKVLAEKIPINILINNAGIMAVPYKETQDGFESHFQVNYLSHFLLTNLLLPQMLKTSKETGIRGRIVNVSAALQAYGTIDFDNLQLKKDYVPLLGYFNTKLMQVVMTKYLDDKIQKEGDGGKVQVNSLHPGVVPTELASHMPGFAISSFIMSKVCMTLEQAMNEVMYVAVSSQVQEYPGEFFVYGKTFPAAEKDSKVLEKLWNLSVKLTGDSKD